MEEAEGESQMEERGVSGTGKGRTRWRRAKWSTCEWWRIQDKETLVWKRV